jgi:PAS domain S-box-containing protein
VDISDSAVLNSLPNPFMIVDRERRIVRINDSTKKYLGDVVGKRCFEVTGCGKEDSEDCPAILAFEGKRGAELVHAPPLHLLVNAEPVGEEANYAILVATDITKLWEAELRYNEIFENSMDIIAITDSTGKIVDISPIVERILGFKRDEMIGHYISDFIQTADAKLSYEKELQEFNIEFKARTKDGSPVYLEGRIIPLFRGKELTGFLGVYRDITKRKELESRLRERGVE